MKTLLSLLMAIVMSLSTLFAGTPLQDYFDLLMELLGAQNPQQYVTTLQKTPVVPVTEDGAYLPGVLFVFCEEDASFAQKMEMRHALDAKVIAMLPEDGLYVLGVKEQSLDGMQAVCDKAEALAGVAMATPSLSFHYSPDYTPNDPFDYYEDWDETDPAGGNWWLEAIEARNAWAYRTFMQPIKVGIVDSGFEPDHEDLQGKVSFPGRRWEKRYDVSDHGIHVSGIVAANADNGVGISGVNPMADLICADWEYEEGSWINEFQIFFGTGACIKKGAKVVNFSVGSSSSVDGDKEKYADSMVRSEAALYSFYLGRLLRRGYDFVIVQSAGNGNEEGYAINSKYNGLFCGINQANAVVPVGVKKADVIDRIIVVGCARNTYNRTYEQTYYSNVGEGVDICAPGNSIYSCYSENSYGYMSGTSMAAPVVTGVASLVWSINPNLSGAAVKKIVCESTCETASVYPDYYFDNSTRLAVDLPMVNARLAVEAAVKSAYFTFTVNGKTPDPGYYYNNEFSLDFADARGNALQFNFPADTEFSMPVPVGNYHVTANHEAGCFLDTEMTGLADDITSLEFSEMY